MFDASQIFLLMLVVEIENDLNLKMKNKEHTFLMRYTYSGKSRKLAPCGDPSSFCRIEKKLAMSNVQSTTCSTDERLIVCWQKNGPSATICCF